MMHDPIFFTPNQSARFGQARTLYKGGGAPEDTSVAREAERQDRIAQGTAAINSIFGVGNQTTKVPTGQRNLTGYTRSYTDGAGNKQTETIDQNKYNSLQTRSANQSQPQYYIGDDGQLAQRYSTGSSADGMPEPAGGVAQMFASRDDYTPQYQDVMTDVLSPAHYAAQQRQSMYDGLRDDTRKFYASQLEDDKASAQRELGFQKARQGIIGSSQANDIDTNFQKSYDRGLLDVANRAGNAETQFRTSDETSRLNLISKVVAGLDQGTAAQNAASTLQTNQNAAKEAYQSQRMSNVFGDLLNTYNQGQYLAGTNQAKQQGQNQYGNVFVNDSAYSGEKS